MGRVLIVVCHANHGTVVSAALAGKPLPMMPDHLEQALTTRCVEGAGLGCIAARKPRASLVAQRVQQLAHSATARARTARLSEGYRAFRDAGRTETIRRLEGALHG